MKNNPVDVHQAKEELKKMIVECMVKNEKLPTEKEMVARFGLSRSVLRDMLTFYEANGIIVSHQGSGRTVQIPNFGVQLSNTLSIFLDAQPTMLLDLLEIRAILEIATLPSVINKIDITKLQELRKQVRAMKDNAAQDKGFSNNDRNFHQILFSTVDNNLLYQLLSAFWDMYEKAQINPTHEGLQPVAEQHEAILDAIVRKDLQQCETLMKAQFEDARYQILNSVISQPAQN